MAKKKNKKPDLNTGLYVGDMGANAAKVDPKQFYNFTLANEGRTAGTTSPFGWNYLQNQGFEDIWNRFGTATAINQNTSFLDHMANTYGAPRTPTATNPFAGGSVITPAVSEPPARKRRRRRR